MGGVPKVFSRRTLEKFEDASASIVLRQIDRAFQDADIRLGEDPGTAAVADLGCSLVAPSQI
jgi:hypothetical protein